MPGPRNPSAWPLRNRRLWGRLAATAHAFGRRALAVRGARRQLHNSRGAGDPLARFASRTHVRQVPEGALPPCLRHVLAAWNVFGSPIGLSQTLGRRTINSGLTALRKEADGMGRDQAASGPIAALRTTDERYTSVVWELEADGGPRGSVCGFPTGSANTPAAACAGGPASRHPDSPPTPGIPGSRQVTARNPQQPGAAARQNRATLGAPKSEAIARASKFITMCSWRTCAVRLSSQRFSNSPGSSSKSNSSPRP